MTTIIEQPRPSSFGNISPFSNTFAPLTQGTRPSDGDQSSIRSSVDGCRHDTMMSDASKDPEAAQNQFSSLGKAETEPAHPDSVSAEAEVEASKPPVESTMSSTETEVHHFEPEHPSAPTSRRPSAVPEAFASMLHDIDAINDKRWTLSKEETIRGPYDYISSAPGKEFRTQLIGGLNLWHQVPKESLDVIASVVRMLHNASLLIDDIQDNSTLRRGRPVAHSVYGVAQTINSANFIYFLALAELQKLRNPKAAVDVFTQEMLALHRGQGMDLYWRDTLSCPTEADYLEMVSNKTGGLFRLAVRLMQTESEMGVDCMPLINIMGLIFQIADDYKNLADKNYTESKGYCEDLTEGKFSFPVIHSIHASSGNQVLLNILSQKPTAFEVKRHAVEYMESTGSLEYTRQFVEALSAKARELAVQLDLRCGINSNVTLSLVEKMARI